MTLEDQIKALLEANEKKDADAAGDDKEPADHVDPEPAVKIENPMDPNLTSSDVATSPQDEIAAAETQGAADVEAEQGLRNQEEPESKEADADEGEDKDKDKKKADQVTESIADLLGNEFSDEFKLKAQTIFEAAVKDKVLQIQEKLQEEHQAAVAVLEEKFQEKLVTRSQQLDEENSDKIDGYLNFLAEEWKKDNQIALESAIKTELTESFITQLKSVFEQHYFDLPEEKVDAYSKALEEKAEVESALATTVGSLKKLTEELNQIRREQIIAESTKDLAGLDATRLVALTEDFAFEDAETFKQKVSIVKTQFFGKKSSQAKEQLTEELTKSTPIVEEVTAVETVQEGNAMSAYVKALRK